MTFKQGAAQSPSQRDSREPVSFGQTAFVIPQTSGDSTPEAHYRTVESLVTRIFDGGRVTPHDVRNSGAVRGNLSVREEVDHTDIERPWSPVLREPLWECGPSLPLFDVVLLGATGESWTLAGYERITSGGLQQEFFLGQTWLVAPAPREDLRNAEKEWARFSKLLAEVQQREK